MVSRVFAPHIPGLTDLSRRADGSRLTRCTPAPSLEEENDYQLVGDPARASAPSCEPCLFRTHKA